MVNGPLPNRGRTKAPGRIAEPVCRICRARCPGAFAQRLAHCVFAPPNRMNFLTMKIVQILGKIADNLI
jgi:hypothetical protein